MLDYRLKESRPDIQTHQETDAKTPELAQSIPPLKPRPKPSRAPKQEQSLFLQWLYNLPISRKQLIIAGTSFASIVGLVGLGSLLTFKGLQNQLLHQAISEVAVTNINYNIKINQMGFGFRGQADNVAIINATKAQTLTPALQSQVKQILQNEVRARKIEYATLVGKDLRIIVNANANRQGEVFNPNNLVKQVFSDPRQIKASAIVSRAELTKESPPLPPGFNNQDALIRYTVTPVKDPVTKTIIGALVSGDIVNKKLPIVEGTLKAFGDGYSAVYYRQPTGEFALASALDLGSSQNLAAAQPDVGLPNTSLLAKAVAANGKQVTGRTQIGGQNYTLAAQALPNVFKEEASGSVPVSSSNPVAILVRGVPNTELNALLRNSLLTQLILGSLALLLNVGLALIIGRAVAKPIRELQRTAQGFSRGDREARAEVFGHDEVGRLAVTFNEMADNIDANLETRRQEAERKNLFADIASSRTLDEQDLGAVFDKAVEGALKILDAERVFVYRFNPDWTGIVVSEAVVPGCSSCLGEIVNDTYFMDSDEGVEKYKNGRIFVIDDTHKTNLTDCHLDIYRRFEIRANLIVPIVRNDQLMGLLCAQQCSGPRAWQQSEVDFLAQLARQVGFSLDRVVSLAQMTAIKDNLQKRALELLMEVDPVSRGDLTIRANVTEDEIGTVADSYNATIESLRRIVTQVQAAAQQMTTTTSSNTQSVQGLATEALRQTEEINAALNRIQEMSSSIRAVATSAEQAEAAVQQANQTVKAGDAAMNRTVDGILAIRETVAETSKKVKRLGESSQKISKVVNLIGTFADKTNLLALNASIEAAHAGEQGRGFAVVADQVRALARQSAQATAEIETLVATIQTETNEVVAAMESGTEQVVEGTRLVDETRQSLNQITAASAQISGLVEAIAAAAVTQSQTSESVTQTMSNVAANNNQTSNEATQVSASFNELLKVAQQLQASVAQFKVS